MKKNHYTTLLLDYGGTLDTNARHWAHVLWDGYQHCNVPVSESQFREAYVFGERSLAKSPIIVPTDNFLDLLRKKVDIETSYLQQHSYWSVTDEERSVKSDAIAQFCYAYARRHVDQSRQVLRLLKEQYKLLLVTNFYGNIQAVLADFGLEGMFQSVIESAVVGVRKPDPAIWAMGMDAAGEDAGAIIAVGDSVSKDILPAKELGFHTVWMQGQGWDDKEQESDAPDMIIHDIKELPEAILQLQALD